MTLQYLNVSVKSDRSMPSRRAAPGARPGGRKARERARRRAEVLGAARRLYARKGYQNTAMVEIARASELAVGTLYQLFPSKEAILRSLLEDRVDELVGRVRAAVDGHTDVRDQLRQIVDTHLAFARDNADILRLYLSGWIGYDTRTRQRFGDRIDARYERYVAVLTSVFKRGVESGALAPRPPRRLAVTLAGLIHAVIRRGLRERRIDFMAEGEALLDVLLHGVLPREPGPGGAR
jgi:AcrR family transcriptional regulator